MPDCETNDFIVQGRIKWYDGKRGLGFIKAEHLRRDVLLHANVLRSFGRSTVAEQTLITVRCRNSSHGLQATEVIDLEAPELSLAFHGSGEFFLPADELAKLPVEPARIKWFNPAVGYGFANVFGKPEDVFVHAEIARAGGCTSLDPGEALVLRNVNGARGRVAVQVLPWEAM